MAAAVSLFRGHWPAFEVRTLESLHAKCVLIDDYLAYCGSANWYRFSLEKGCEVTIRGPAEAVSGLAAQLEELWGQSAELRRADTVRPPAGPPAGIREEVIDPVAAAVLAADPKAFVLGKKRRR
jgi:phosphatidylserine/phosphatidylglycerophosphate/cardiolipin synthase-like enzyme